MKLSDFISFESIYRAAGATSETLRVAECLLNLRGFMHTLIYSRDSTPAPIFHHVNFHEQPPRSIFICSPPLFNRYIHTSMYRYVNTDHYKTLFAYVMQVYRNHVKLSRNSYSVVYFSTSRTHVEKG